MNTIKTCPATESALSELAGRMYECIDIGTAIEQGLFKSLDALRSHLEAQASRLNRTIKAAEGGQPLVIANSCLVLAD